MMESLRTWATPYGGDPFLYISLLAIVSLVALLLLKARLSAFTLNRFIRLGALIALPLSFVSMEMGDNQTVHAFEAEALAGGCGGSSALWTYTIFGANTADATA